MGSSRGVVFSEGVSRFYSLRFCCFVASRSLFVLSILVPGLSSLFFASRVIDPGYHFLIHAMQVLLSLSRRKEFGRRQARREVEVPYCVETKLKSSKLQQNSTTLKSKQ